MPFVNIQPIKNGDSATPALFNSRFGKIADTINGGLDSANLVDGAITTEKITDAAITPEKISATPDWQTVTYTNSWTTYSTDWGVAAYYKDHVGVVHMRGLLKSGTIGQSMFTLPAGYRPAIRLVFASQSNDTINRIDVTADGQVIPTTGNNAWVSISNITFRAEQ